MNGKAYQRKKLAYKLESLDDYSKRRFVSWKNVIYSICDDISQGTEEQKRYFIEFLKKRKDLACLVRQWRYKNYLGEDRITSQLESKFSKNKLRTYGNVYGKKTHSEWTDQIHDLWGAVTSKGLLGTPEGLESLEKRLIEKREKFRNMKKSVSYEQAHLVDKNLDRMIGHIRNKRAIDDFFKFDYSHSFNKEDYRGWIKSFDRLKYNGFGDSIHRNTSLAIAIAQKRAELEEYISKNANISKEDIGYLSSLFKYLEHMFGKKIKEKMPAYNMQRYLGINKGGLNVDRLRERLQAMVKGKEDPSTLMEAVEGFEKSERDKRYILNAIELCKLVKKERYLKSINQEGAIPVTVRIDKDILDKFGIRIVDNPFIKIEPLTRAA